MAEKTYTSVMLSKKVDGALHCRTMWIQPDHAVEGKKLRVKIDGEWDEVWVVQHVYGTQKARIVKAYAGQYKKTREVSDVDRDGDREKVTA